MASYSLQRETAKHFLSSERFAVPGWTNFHVQGPFLINTFGQGVHRNVIEQLDHYLYIHRLIGYTSDWLPAPAGRPYLISYNDERIERMLERIAEQLNREGVNS